MAKYCIVLSLCISIFACEPVKHKHSKKHYFNTHTIIAGQSISQNEIEIVFLKQLTEMNELYIYSSESVLKKSSLTMVDFESYFKNINEFITNATIKEENAAILAAAIQFISNNNEANKTDFKQFNCSLLKKLFEKQIPLR